MASSALPLNQLPVTEEAALWAYRLILGREPESREVVDDHLRTCSSLAKLRKQFFESSEFTERYRRVESEVCRNVSVFPPCSIQTVGDPESTTRLFEHVARNWNELGAAEPYWSVMSEPQYLMERIGQTREAFLDSGREHVERLLATLKRNGVALDPAWKVLELGCGLGRNTRWLVRQVAKVYAVDVSATHLALAKRLNADTPDITRAEWIQLVNPGSIAELPECDLFFSMIVLQHNPPPVIRLLLERAAAGLRPGGIAFFQVPTYQRGYSFDIDGYLRQAADNHEIEMHAFPQGEVFRIFREHGCVPLEVFEDGLSGHRDNHRSNTFLFRKQAVDADARTALRKSTAHAQTLEREIARMDAAAKQEHAAAQTALVDAARYAASLEHERDALKRALAAAEAVQYSDSHSHTDQT